MRTPSGTPAGNCTAVLAAFAAVRVEVAPPRVPARLPPALVLLPLARLPLVVLAPDVCAVDLLAAGLLAAGLAAAGLLAAGLLAAGFLAPARLAAGLVAVDLAAVPPLAATPFPWAVAGVVLAPLLARFAALAAGGVRDCAMSSCPSLAGASGPCGRTRAAPA